MRLILVIAAFFLMLAPVAARENPSGVLAKAVGHIQTGFSQFAESSEGLEADMAALCDVPSEAALQKARGAFGRLVQDFSRIEFIRFGPLVEDNRSERILFWPDRKGIGLKQVQAILAAHDETVADAATLREKSVAAQGLPALEYVLFGTGSETLPGDSDPFRCRYGLAIAGALKRTAAELRDAWLDPAGIAQRLAHPQAANTDFRSTRESFEALVGILAHGVEAVRDTRLLPFIGREGEQPKPKSALFWRSGLTVPSIRANFEGLSTLLGATNIGLATDEENLWVDNGARFEFGNALRAADTVTLSVERALGDERQRKALDYLVILTQSLQTLLGENLAAALGLSVGFSSLDGD